jgi:hypothetical protein
LHLADLSIDFGNNGRIEGSLEHSPTIFLSAKSDAGCHYILIISDRETNIGRFFLFSHVDLLVI